AAPAAETKAAGPSDARKEYLDILNDAGEKLMQLAQAVPPNKYTWRPAPGVRSFSEVFLHVAGGNFMIPRPVGVQPPADLNMQDPRNFDKSTTDKTKVIELLKKSFEHARRGGEIPQADLEKTTQWFGGRQITYRAVLFFLATHAHEHLGQSIAYARMNG